MLETMAGVEATGKLRLSYFLSSSIVFKHYLQALSSSIVKWIYKNLMLRQQRWCLRRFQDYEMDLRDFSNRCSDYENFGYYCVDFFLCRYIVEVKKFLFLIQLTPANLTNVITFKCSNNIIDEWWFNQERSQLHNKHEWSRSLWGSQCWGARQVHILTF